MIASLRLKRAHCCTGCALAPPPGVEPYHSVGAIGSNETFVPCGTFATSQSRVSLRVSSRPMTIELRTVVYGWASRTRAPTSAPNTTRWRTSASA